MDDTDRKLLVLIGANPRIHIRDLAKRLGISRQAVDHRMQILTKIGVIKGMIAGISIPYLDAVPVTVFGKSMTASVEKTFDRLGESEFSRRVVVTGGNFLYVVGFLRNISELGSYVEFVKRAAEMPEPTVGINCLDDGLSPDYPVDGVGKRKQSYKELSPLDLKIIASLKDNARRPVADIADMVGASAKTVRRHLENMMSEGSLDLSMPSDLALGGDMFLVTHVNLRDGADKGEVGRRLLSKSPFQDQYMRTFSNLPSLLIWVFWSGKMTEIRKALREVGEDEDVLAVMVNFAFLERIYTTWRDKLPEVRTRPSEKTNAHNLHSGLGTR
ncbi:MAG TPA: winged helix-turn-helix transcriptional regulator [Thermoplasmata archaeon]